jgi:hypothetical protein
MTTAHNARQRLAAKRAEIAAQLADPTVAATTCTLTPIDFAYDYVPERLWRNLSRPQWTRGVLDAVVAATNGTLCLVVIDQSTGHTARRSPAQQPRRRVHTVYGSLVGTGRSQMTDTLHVKYHPGGEVFAHHVRNIGAITPLEAPRAKWDTLDLLRLEQRVAINEAAAALTPPDADAWVKWNAKPAGGGRWNVKCSHATPGNLAAAEGRWAPDPQLPLFTNVAVD